MKKSLLVLAVIVIHLTAPAQTPGTTDPGFAQEGTFTFAVTGQELMANFMNLWQNMEEGRQVWKIIAGGNLYKNYMHSGVFLLEIPSEGDPSTWHDQPDNGFVSLQNAIYLADGSLLMIGSAQFNGPHLASATKMSSIGVFDNTYGVHSLKVIDEAGPSYLYGICHSQVKSDDPYLMLGGAGAKGEFENDRAWWKMGPEGDLLSDFGTDGRLMPTTHATSAWVWDVKPAGNLIGSVGAFDNKAIFTLFNASGGELTNVYYPAGNNPDQIADFFTFNFDATHYYACGYIYNTATNKSSASVLTLNRETLDPENTRYGGFTPAFTAIEQKFGGYLTGINNLFPCTRYSGAMKSDAEHPMLMVGSIMLAGDHESTFIAAVNEDGNLADDFAGGGAALVDFKGSNWPVDVVMLTDGTFFIAINEYEVNKTHIVKFFGYTDRSGILQPEISEDYLSLYPVPASTELHAEIRMAGAGEIDWIVRSISGQLILKGKTTPDANGSVQLKIDLKALPTGYYLMEARSNKQLLTQPFTLNR